MKQKEDIMLVKFLGADRRGPYSGVQWPAVGEWLKAEGNLELCSNGIHYPAPGQEVQWIAAEAYELQIRGKVLEGDGKHCARSGRLVRRLDLWGEQAQRLFAADCAEDVLHLFEKMHPDDMRPRDAIRIARLFAIGRASAAAGAAAGAAARAAAWDAALAAAWAAAWDATRAAAWAWQSARLMQAMTNPDWLANRVAHARGLEDTGGER